MHVVHDGVDESLILLERIGVIQPEEAAAAELFGDREVEADRLGVADVQVAVGLGRKPRDDHRLTTARQIVGRSEEHTSELQSLMRISYAVFCLKKKKTI